MPIGEELVVDGEIEVASLGRFLESCLYGIERERRSSGLDGVEDPGEASSVEEVVLAEVVALGVLGSQLDLEGFEELDG